MLGRSLPERVTVNVAYRYSLTTWCLMALTVGCDYLTVRREQESNPSPLLLGDPDVGLRHGGRPRVCVPLPSATVKNEGCQTEVDAATLRNFAARVRGCSSAFGADSELDGTIAIFIRMSGATMLESRAWSTGAIPSQVVSCVQNVTARPLAGMVATARECRLTVVFEVNRYNCPLP